MTAIRIIISGHVQGVGYRAWTVETANAFGLKGWVRNRSEGTVEALFSGKEATVHAMIEACKKGPAFSRVDGIDSYAAEESGEKKFTAKPNA